MSAMNYKNYLARVDYDDDDGIFHRRIAGRKLSRSVAVGQGTTPRQAQATFANDLGPSGWPAS